MKRILVFASLLIGVTASAQTDILDARSYSTGSTVTVTGIATNGSELGSIRYMQDGTAGIAAYGGPITGVSRGDSITVTGPLIEFSGLLEISTVTNVVNHGPAVIPVTPLQIPISAAGEVYESQLMQIDNVTFVQTGSFATGNSTVQVTDGANTLDIRINGSTNIDGTAIPTGPVTIYGAMGQFNTNYQIVPRDLNDIVPYTAPDKEINVTIGSTTYLTGSSYFLGTTANTSFTVENLGVNTLTLSSHNFSGPDAADFSANIPGGATIAGGASATYTLTYSPSSTGSIVAAINILSDDADEGTYTINLNAIGTDNLATEPTANPTGLTFSNIEAYTLSGQFAAGTGADKYLVLWKNGSAITGAPTDGTTYLRGDVVGDARVAYVGGATGFTPRGIIANQNYYFAVYAFNGQGGYENYLTSTPATGNTQSTGENIGTYYNGISTQAPTFVSDLSAVTNPHTFISYFNYKQTMMNEFEVRDTTNGDSYVLCYYSGERKVFSGSFDWQATNFSREHCYPHSWMPSNPADNPEQPEYTDQHNLLPVNFSNVNAVRSNYPLGEVVTVQSSYLGAKYGQDANGNTVYEPTDEMKGNAARAMMYEAIAYNGDNGGQNWAFPDPISPFIPYIPYGQDQEVLKSWHFNDQPDDYEIARNEYVFSIQGNRNPFIDSVDFVCFVDFTSMNYDALGCQLSIDEALQTNFNVYPVPASDLINMQVNGTEINTIKIVDLQGRVVYNNDNVNEKAFQLNVKDFNTGAYFLTVSTPYGNAQQKIIIE